MSYKSVYLDYAATTPVAPEVLQVMQPYFAEKFGNPGSLHRFGQEAIAAVDRSRETIAAAIGADFRDIVFTGSATEANNLALRGVIKGITNHESGIRGNLSIIHNSKFIIPKIIVSAIEHESVLETARDLETEGVEVVYLKVDKSGRVDLGQLRRELDERTVLVSVMYANNEIGTVQPIAEISEIIRNFRNSKHEARNPKLTTGHPEERSDEGTRDPSLRSGRHRNVSDFGFRISDFPVMSALITGGGQEFGLRSGTENVPLIVGFAQAVRMCGDHRYINSKVIAIRGYFWRSLKRVYPKAQLNGPTDSIPSIINVYLPGQEAQEILTRLDLAGIATSAGSACSSRSLAPSYVIRALGHSEERARQSVRFSFGRTATKAEIDRAIKIIKVILSSRNQK